jgi:hypothetical protein
LLKTDGPARAPRKLFGQPSGRAPSRFENQEGHRHLLRMSEERERFDPTDYSVVVKLRGNPPKPWRWEIYRAGRWGPVESSQVLFESAAEAAKEGKKALARLLATAA